MPTATDAELLAVDAQLREAGYAEYTQRGLELSGRRYARHNYQPSDNADEYDRPAPPPDCLQDVFMGELLSAVWGYYRRRQLTARQVRVCEAWARGGLLTMREIGKIIRMSEVTAARDLGAVFDLLQDDRWLGLWSVLWAAFHMPVPAKKQGPHKVP